MTRLFHLFTHSIVKAILETLGGCYLAMTTYWIVVYHVAFGAMSLVAATTGAILGLHGVCKLVLPAICGRKEKGEAGGPPHYSG